MLCLYGNEYLSPSYNFWITPLIFNVYSQVKINHCIIFSGGYKSGKEEHGAHGLNNKKQNEEYDYHEEKGGHKGFKKEGEVYDKHGSDHKGKLEKNQHVKGEEEVSKHGGHGQAGGKVGSEFIKDKGHKTHGFKNVYHKGLC